MKLRVLVTLLCGALITSACTKKSKVGYGLNVEDTLRVSILTEPPSLDWNKSSDTTSSLVTTNIMEGLVGFDLNDPELATKPALATSWESSNNHKTWTFNLRKGVKWNDGVAFTAQQVVDSWQRLLAPKTASDYASFLFTLKNAKAFNSGEIKDFAQVGVKAIDKHTLLVNLESPQSFFPKLLNHHSTYPIRLDVVAKHGDQWTEPENIVTLGAYNLKVWEHDKALVLERNPSYHGTAALTKNVILYIIHEMSTAINLFDAGKIDAMNDLPSVEIVKLRERKEYRRINQLGIYYLGFNVEKAPMDNTLVRKAINMAINREEITNLLAGGQIPISGFVPEGMMGYSKDIGLKYDPVTAAKLLDQAGFTDRTTFPKLEIGFNTNENHKRLAENVQAQLKKNLGINIELKNEEWKVYLKSLNVDPPHIWRMGWIADFPDPDNFLNLMMTNSSNNRTRWGNAEYDRLIDKAVSVANEATRKQLYAKAQKILTEAEVPVIPIYSYVIQALVSDRVQNYPINRLQKFQYKNVTLGGKKVAAK